MAATSRAIPVTLRQSGRFGVRSISKTVSAKPRASSNFVPMFNEASSFIMPLASAPRQISASLHSMPSEDCPRITVFSSTDPSGNTVPGNASGASIPALTLGAPQTTENWRSLNDTRHNFSLSALGCGLISSMRATNTVLKYA